MTEPSPRYFVWPEHDRSYMKTIFRHPSTQYPHGFHVLGSRFHPIGDFDNPGVHLPAEPLRIYRTAHGWRVFFIGRHDVNVDDMFDELDALGGDPLYSRYGRKKRYFAMRVDPKTHPVPPNWAVTSLVEQTGPLRPEWERLVSRHDALTRALEKNTVLV